MPSASIMKKSSLRDLFAAWVARYRLALPVDKDRPFTASLFTGLALRNQPDFDELGQDVRYEASPRATISSAAWSSTAGWA